MTEHERVRQGGSRAYARITNNFLHDMATGTWAACLLVQWVIARRIAGAPDEAVAVLAEASTVLFWLLVGALIVIALTGGIRLRYWKAEAAPGTVAETRKALITKHIAFLVIYGGGTWWGWTLIP